MTAPGACGAVVKADAYGLGLEKVGRALGAAGCERFFVATIDEGISLRRAIGARPFIYVLNGMMAVDAAGEFASHGLTPVLNSPGDIGLWGAHCRNSDGGTAILALDTGMHRLGLTPAEVRDLAGAPGLLDGISIDYIMSHLACAEDPHHPMNEEQRRRFDALRGTLTAAPASLANSGGIFLGSAYHYDLSRPGAALYGVSRTTGAPDKMKQVVGLKGKILQIRVVDSESTVGYGASGSVPAGSRLATVAVGYADGYLRSLGNSGHGYAAGVKIPVVGRISMDLITFDITAVPAGALAPGDDIEMIGENQTVDDLADEAATIGYEILTSLGRRYARRYIGAAS
jgi:alanine racemase